MTYNYTSSQKPKKLPKFVGCMILSFIIRLIFMFIMTFLVGGISMYKNSPVWGKILFLILGIVILISIIIKIKRIVRLKNAIESGEVIRKGVKIINFKKGESNDHSGYYVIFSDGEKEYKSSFHEGARIIGKSEESIKKDKFYDKNLITLDLENREVTREQLDKKIADLELQRENANFFKQLKIDLKISMINLKKQNLEPYHLHTHEGDFYIGEKNTVLIDPADPDNYTIESDIKY